MPAPQPIEEGVEVQPTAKGLRTTWVVPWKWVLIGAGCLLMIAAGLRFGRPISDLISTPAEAAPPPVIADHEARLRVVELKGAETVGELKGIHAELVEIHALILTTVRSR
jgi:hypothetical protein